MTSDCFGEILEISWKHREWLHTELRLRVVSGIKRKQPAQPALHSCPRLIQVMQTRETGAAAPTSRRSCRITFRTEVQESWRERTIDSKLLCCASAAAPKCKPRYAWQNCIGTIGRGSGCTRAAAAQHGFEASSRNRCARADAGQHGFHQRWPASTPSLRRRR